MDGSSAEITMTGLNNNNDTHKHWYQRPITWAFMFLLFLISIISWVSLTSLNSIKAEYITNSQVQVQKLRLLDELVHYSRQRSVLLRDIVLSNDPFEKDEIIQKHSNLATHYLLARDALVKLSHPKTHKTLVDMITKSNSEGYALQNTIIELSLSGESEKAIVLLNQKLGPNRERIYPAMLELRDLLVYSSKMAADDVKNIMALSRNTIMLLYVAIICLGIFVAWLAIRQDRKAFNKIVWQASHDKLTGLLNRQEFEPLLSNIVNKAHDGEYHSALLYMDIDQFNMINNTSGHSAGDELLCQVTSHLETCIGSEGVIGRMGGDQFAIILTNINKKQTLDHADNIIKKMHENRFSWMDRTYDVTLSVGIIFTNIEQGSLEDIWTGAYISCELAKESGGNQYSIYQPDRYEIIRKRKQLNWSTRIKDALVNDKLVLYSQPIESATNHRIHSEVLLRFEADDGQKITADQFIPAAERYHLITDVDLYVVNKTLKFMKDSATGNSYAINLSGTTLGNNSIAREIINLIYHYGINPKLICFEVTETAAITNRSNAIRFMNLLHGIGCHFFLDDFGSGLSSFGYLRTLPIDAIKIDGFFIKNMEADSANLSVIKAVNNIAHGFGLKTIAECVETPTQLEHLKSIGVDYFQGYYIQKPMPLIAA